MNGLEMMLKSFGVDPDEIKNSMKGTVEAIKTFDGRLLAIERAILTLDGDIHLLGEKIDGRTDIAGPSNYEPGREYCTGCGAAVSDCTCRSTGRSLRAITA